MARSSSNEVLKILSGIHDRDLHTTLHDFFIMGAIAVRNAVDFGPQRAKFEKRYMDIAGAYKPEQLQIFAKALAVMKLEFDKMLNGDKEFRDYCGELYMESATSNDKSGQFFTPYSVSRCCAQSTFDLDKVKADIAADPHNVLTILEPSCGAGGMIIAAVDVLNQAGVNYAHNVYADCTDVDERCVAMTYLQLSFLGVPAKITHGNTLSLSVISEWFTPAYLFQYIHFRHRLTIQKRGLFQPKEAPQDITAPPEQEKAPESPQMAKEPKPQTTEPPQISKESCQLSLF